MRFYILSILFIVIACTTAVTTMAQTATQQALSTAAAKTATANAQTSQIQPTDRITEKQTAQYVTNCLKNSAKDQTMTEQTKQILCTCTASFMQQNLTMSDLKAMNVKSTTPTAQESQLQRNALNKMMTKVYAPCMEFPVHDLIQKQCMTDVKNKTICNCVSKNMAAYTAQSAQTTLGDVLAKNPNTFDPMGAIIDSPAFQTQQKSITLQCITGKLK